MTNHVTQDIASVPLLWIAPLAIYLLTFILCFDASGWYRSWPTTQVTLACLQETKDEAIAVSPTNHPRVRIFMFITSVK